MSSVGTLVSLPLLLLNWAAAASEAPSLDAAPVAGDRLHSVPSPALEPFETPVQQQLLEERGALDGLIEEGGPAGEKLGRAYGWMGQLYLLYDLAQPAEACFLNARVLIPDDFRWPYYLGSLYRLEGRLVESAERYQQALAIRPGYAPALVRLGQVLLDQDERQVAARNFQQVPDSAAAHYGLGRAAYAVGDYASALEHLTTALKLQPEANLVHHLLGMSYRELGELDRARQHLARNRNQAVQVDDPLLDGLGSFITGARVHFKTAMEAVSRGELQLAASEFRLALQIDPSDYLAHYNLALALLKLGMTGDGEAALRAAVGVNPKFRNGYFNLAVLAVQAEHWEEAATHFEAAYRIDPQDVEAHLEWATALSKAGRPEQARKELGELLGADPGNDPQAVDIQNRLAEALGRAGLFGEAAAAYARVVRQKPDALRAHFGQAMALILGGDYREAQEGLERSLGAFPGNVPLSHALARLLATCPEESVRDGERAAQLAFFAFGEEETLEHAETIAMALAEQDNFTEALRWQRRVVIEAEKLNDPPRVAQSRRRLELYESSSPVRAPWRESG